MSRQFRVEWSDFTFVSLEFDFSPFFGHFLAKQNSLLSLLVSLSMYIYFHQLWIELLLLLHMYLAFSDIEGIGPVESVDLFFELHQLGGIEGILEHFRREQHQGVVEIPVCPFI